MRKAADCAAEGSGTNVLALPGSEGHVMSEEQVRSEVTWFMKIGTCLGIRASGFVSFGLKTS